jgi:hypothetical protein
MSSSQNQFYSHINRKFITGFISRGAIEYSKFEIRGGNLEFWDQLDVNFDSKWGIDHGVCVYYAKCILMLTFPQLK